MPLESPFVKKTRFKECNSGCFEDFVTQLAATQPRNVQTWLDVNGVPDQGENKQGALEGCLFSKKCSSFKIFVSQGPRRKFLLAEFVETLELGKLFFNKDYSSAKMIFDWIRIK